MYPDHEFMHACGIAAEPASDQPVPAYLYARALDECERLRYKLSHERFRNYRTPFLRVSWALGFAMLLLIASWAGTAAEAFVRWWK